MKRGALELDTIAKFLIIIAVIVVIGVLIFIFRDKIIELFANLKEKIRGI